MSNKRPQPTDVLVKRLRRVATALDRHADTYGVDDYAAWHARANTCWQVLARLEEYAALYGPPAATDPEASIAPINAELCYAPHFNGWWYCALQKGHTGLHIASIGPPQHVLAAWEPGPAPDAVDPQVPDAGTPKPRDDS